MFTSQQVDTGYEGRSLAYVLSPEDTFLLLDAIEEEADELRQLKPLLCLEIG